MAETLREDEEITKYLIEKYPELETLEPGKHTAIPLEDLNKSATVGSEFGSFNIDT